MTLPAEEFLERLSLHILPRGFVRVRAFGFLANCHRSEKLALIRGLLHVSAAPSAGDALKPPLSSAVGTPSGHASGIWWLQPTEPLRWTHPSPLYAVLIPWQSRFRIPLPMTAIMSPRVPAAHRVNHGGRAIRFVVTTVFALIVRPRSGRRRDGPILRVSRTRWVAFRRRDRL